MDIDIESIIIIIIDTITVAMNIKGKAPLQSTTFSSNIFGVSSKQ